MQLQDKSRDRKKKELFVIEGLREISLAIKGKYKLNTILFCEDIIPLEKVNTLLEKTKKEIEIIQISKVVYQKIAFRKTTEGIVAITDFKKLSLNNLTLSNTPLILIAEAPEKPGNLGALLRTADAAKLDAVIIANPKTDLYNPNIIRASVGCVFTNQIAFGSTEEIITFLNENNVQIHAAALKDESEIYTAINYKNASAIVVGTEATGLSDQWLNSAHNKIIIPMQGEIDSLNVSVSAAIIIFEAKRQRNKN